MIRSRIAQRYARALFELSRDAGKVEEVGEQLVLVDEVLRSEEDLRTALLSPVLPRRAKKQVVETFLEVAQVDALVANFLRVLLEARKLPYLGDMVSAYGAMADQEAGRERGEATTLMPLNQDEVKHLAAVLSKALDKEVLLSARLDPSILGGVVVRVGNLVFDGSLRTQLRRMKETLSKG